MSLSERKLIEAPTPVAQKLIEAPSPVARNVGSSRCPHGTIERNPSVERNPFYWDDKVYGPD